MFLKNQILLSSLTKIIKRSFVVKNYMKTFQIENTSRNHGIFRVDQHKKFVSKPQNINNFIEKQKQKYEELRQNWKQRTEQYYKKTHERRDMRHTSAGQHFDNYEYITKVNFHEDKQYTQIYRKKVKTVNQELVLDIMQYPSIKKHFKTVQLLKTSFSDSHDYLAFGFDLYNNQNVSFMIKHVKDNRIVGIKNWQGNMLQNVDNLIFRGEKGIFYTQSENRRPCKLFYQDFDSQAIQLIHQKNPEYFLQIQLSKDKKYLIINSNSKQNTKSLVINISQKSKKIDKTNYKTELKIQEIISEFKNSQKISINHTQNFFIIQRQNAQRNYISILEDQKLNQKQKIIHQLNPEEILYDYDLFKNYMVLYIQKNTKPVLRIISFINNYQISQPDLPYYFAKISPGSNQNYETTEFLVYFNTPFVYNQSYIFSLISNKFKIVQKFQLTGPKFDTKKYQAKTVNIPARDGQLIPMTILSDKYKPYPKKLIMRVYGFYGLLNQPTYNNIDLALLQKNWVIAYPHVRGGGQKGKAWHQAAKGINRYLTWFDIEDCVAWLLKYEYTHPSLLFLHSHSAGAIAVWNMINMSPHLFKGVVMSYPFLDVLTSLMDQKDVLAASDHAQFGNPAKSKQEYYKIHSISPYQNIQKKSYPFIYIIAGLNDYRCPIQQIVKFTKRFRARAQVNNRFENICEKGILLRIQQQSSHLGSSDVSEQNYNNCQTIGFMQYLVHEASNDCKF